MAETTKPNGLSSSSVSTDGSDIAKAKSNLTEDEVKMEEELCTLMRSQSISYEVVRHPPANTIPDLLSFLSFEEIAICKNLALRDKKPPFRSFLVTALHSSDVSIKHLTKTLQCANLRFADESVLMSDLKVKRGALGPFALLYEQTAADPSKQFRLVLDEKLKSYDKMSIHPMHSQASYVVEVKKLTTLLEAKGYPPIWVKFSTEHAARCDNDEKTEESAEPNSRLLGITVKKTDFSEWYTQVIVRSEMVEYYDISGCYIIRPWAFHIWEVVSSFFDKEIKKMGVDNAYFPMFVSKNKLEAEQSHVEGFSPEVAWVTKYGDADLQDPIAIRPTSETIMYPAYAKWIRSHRDLPLLLNMWNTVVRWEFKQPTPFIRTREFLWQEGHTAHATEEEALALAYKILDLYSRWYEEYLAVPVMKGVKSDGEKFAGGKLTTTIEGFIPQNGRGIQAATSHLLGTNFAKMFDIKYEDEKGEKQYVHQTSWGCTTRSIGVMVMIHGDDKGLVLPPKVASVQVVIIPITYKEESLTELKTRCSHIADELLAADIRAKVDDRTNYTPGWKYNHWEVKGVPLRLELGPHDFANESARIVRRDNGVKTDVKWKDITTTISSLLQEIQKDMFSRAKQNFDEGIVKVTEFKDVMKTLNNRKLLLLPWCEETYTEEEVKKETQRLSTMSTETPDSWSSVPALTGAMKPLCIPSEQPTMPEGMKCFWTGKPAKRWTLWGRSY